MNQQSRAAWWNPRLSVWSATAIVLGMILFAVCRVATQKIWIVNELPVAVNVSVGDEVIHVEPHARDYTVRRRSEVKVTTKLADGTVIETVDFSAREDHLYNVLGIAPLAFTTVMFGNSDTPPSTRIVCDSSALTLDMLPFEKMPREVKLSGRKDVASRIGIQLQPGGFEMCRGTLDPATWGQRQLKAGQVLPPELGSQRVVEGAIRLATVGQVDVALEAMNAQLKRDASRLVIDGLSRVMRIAGRTDEAIDARPANGESEEESLAATQQYARLGRHEDALVTSKRCLKKDTCLVAMTRALMGLKRDEEALAELEKSVVDPLSWDVAITLDRVAAMNTRELKTDPFSRLPDDLYKWPPAGGLFERLAFAQFDADVSLIPEHQLLDAFFADPVEALNEAELPLPPWLPSDAANLLLGEALAEGNDAAARRIYERFIDAGFSLEKYRAIVRDEKLPGDLSRLAPEAQAALLVSRGRYFLSRGNENERASAFAEAVRIDPLGALMLFAMNEWPPLPATER